MSLTHTEPSRQCHYAFTSGKLREQFCQALSDMYKEEVPLYGTLLEIIHEVDESTMLEAGKATSKLPKRHELERHGAIRLGSIDELRSIVRLFAIFGMQPVGYYDLTIAGLPLHATAFRPVVQVELDASPFRVFTSLLRHDLLPSRIREVVGSLIRKRNLFQPRLLDLMTLAENHALQDSQTKDAFIQEAVGIFRWHGATNCSESDYRELQAHHPVVADIACFPSLHINHLTPRTLDIDRVQASMREHGMPAKQSIEGPPQRECNVLLRQTSFKALEERVNFEMENGRITPGTHTARFGEVEQRGAALTREGRRRYDLALTRADGDALSLKRNMQDLIPDTWNDLQLQKLVYFRYIPQHKPKSGSQLVETSKLDDLLRQGVISYVPITYEDFLPLSAAGIFASNLRALPSSDSPYPRTQNGRQDLEAALGVCPLDEFDLYQKIQTDSLLECEKALKLRIVAD